MYVEFEEEKAKRKTESSGSLNEFLMRNGIVQTRTQANVVVAVLIIACLLSTYWFYKTSFAEDPNLAPINFSDSWQAGNPSEINNNPR